MLQAMAWFKISANVAAMALGVSMLGASCGQSALALMPGVVNDPQNLSLRREILRYATSSMCTEMLRRSVPLKLRDEDPVTGRFFPSSCYAQDLNNEHLLVQFGGRGYAWTNITKRLGFEAGGAIEYDQDFLMDGSTMYVYFRQKSTSASTFKVSLIEQPAASALGALPVSITGNTTGPAYATAIGNEVLKNEVARGFTVIRRSDGQVDFGLGVVEKGQKPKTSYPFNPRDPSRQVLANERTEIHQEQRDFAGPFVVEDDGSALYLTAAVEGAPAVDVFVMARPTAEQWLMEYTHNLAPTPPSALPLFSETVSSGSVFQRPVRVPKGQYYVIFDNTSSAGATRPASAAGDDRAALVSYAVELGDKP